MHRQKILATTPQRVKQYHRRTYASICICMHTHTYTHIHMYVQPAASMFADVYVGVKTHLCNIHTCPCTSAQNTCKVHVTLTAKKRKYIYTYTHTYTHIYAFENTCTCMTPSTRWSTGTETHNPCTNMHTHTHTHTHVYKRIDVQIHTHMHIYTYILVRTHTHIHIYTAHTRTKCTYEHMHARLERRRGSETCKEPLQTQEALHVFFVRRNQTTFRTSKARTSLYPLPETPIPLHPPSPLLNIPQNSSRTVGKRNFTVLHWSDEQSA